MEKLMRRNRKKKKRQTEEDFHLESDSTPFLSYDFPLVHQIFEMYYVVYKYISILMSTT